MAGYRKLQPEELAWRLDETRFKFHSTAELTPEHGTIGQERARRALDFGLGIKSFGYNIYVLGQSGTRPPGWPPRDAARCETARWLRGARTRSE